MPIALDAERMVVPNGEIVRWLTRDRKKLIRLDAAHWVLEDFVRRVTQSALEPFYGETVKTSGTPLVLVTSNEPGGALQLSLDNTDELQVARLSLLDNLCFAADSGLLFETRIKFSGANPPFSGTKSVFGFASTKNNDADLIANSVWFAVDTSGNLLAETDDGSTDTAKDTGIDIEGDRWYTLRIEVQPDGHVRWYVDDRQVLANQSFQLGSPSSIRFQPYLQVQKAGGTSDPAAIIDFIGAAQAGT